MMTQEKREEIRRRYGAGENSKAIAAAMGVSRGQVEYSVRDLPKHRGRIGEGRKHGQDQVHKALRQDRISVMRQNMESGRPLWAGLETR